MIRLKDFLSEGKKAANSEEEPKGNKSENDAKGKMFEILAAKHLSSHLSPDGQGRLPWHFRAHKDHPNPDLKNKSPTQVHNELLAQYGQEWYETIDKNARSASYGIINHLIKHGIINSRDDVLNVHWTSNADTTKKGPKKNDPKKKTGDHYKLTGVYDPDSYGDITLTINGKNGKTFVPISMKYGTQKEANLRNKGRRELEALSGMPRGSIDAMDKERAQYMHDTFGGIFTTGPGTPVNETQSHKRFKIARNIRKQEMEDYAAAKKAAAAAWTGTKKDFEASWPKYTEISDEAKLAKRAYDAAIPHRRRVASAMATNMINQVRAQGHDGAIRESLTRLLAPKTHFRHLLVYGQSDSSDPNKYAKLHISDAESAAREHLDSYRDLVVTTGTDPEDEKEGGVSLYFHGIHKKTGRVEQIGQLAIKAQDGPFSGTVSSFKMKQASEKSRENPKVAEFANKLALANANKRRKIDPMVHHPSSWASDESGGFAFNKKEQ